MKIKKADL